MDGILDGALSASFAGGRADLAATGLSLVMDELSYGVLLASLKGQLLHANQAARHELARKQVISLHEGHLHTTDATQARILQQALAKAETGRRSLIALRSPTRSRLSIAVVPLRSERHHGNPPVALVFSRATVVDAVMLCFFARTPLEWVLAHRLRTWLRTVDTATSSCTAISGAE